MSSPSVHDYQHQTLNKWLEVRIHRPAEAEPDGSSNERVIFVFNTTGFVHKYFFLEKFEKSTLGKELFYHGTTRYSAINIIEQGIDVTKSTRPVDFSCGKGFYVTDAFEKALEWSYRKQHFDGNERAIIVFTADGNMRREETHLHLKVDNDTRRKFWECIVSHFRHGKTSPGVTRVLEDVKYIEGPVAKNRRLGKDEIPTAADNGSFIQLCICDQGYARKFGSLANILYVVFFN